jgi:beta-lactamase regulating signal transducer with metallopeptidase domain
MMPIIDQTIVNALGWTLVHSLWQGALISLIAVLLLLLMKRSSPKIRYNTLAFLLMLFPFTAIGTFLWIYQEPGIATAQNITLGNPAEVPSGLAATYQGSLSIWDVANSYIAKFRMQVNVYLPLITFIWLAGALFFILRLSGSLLYVRRLKSYGTKPVSGQWQGKLDTLAAKIGLKYSVNLLESTITRVPVVIGWLKPAVLVPAGLLARIPPDQVEAILQSNLCC